MLQLTVSMGLHLENVTALAEVELTWSCNHDSEKEAVMEKNPVFELLLDDFAISIARSNFIFPPFWRVTTASFARVSSVQFPGLGNNVVT